MENNQQQLTSSEARSHLGVVTKMLQGLIPQGQPQGQETPQNAPQTEETTEPTDNPKEEKVDPKGAKMDSVELNLSKKFDDLAKEIKDSQKLEMENIRMAIQEALTKDDAEDKTTTVA